MVFRYSSSPVVILSGTLGRLHSVPIKESIFHVVDDCGGDNTPRMLRILRGLSSVCLLRVNSECRSTQTSYVPPSPPRPRIPDYFVLTGREDSVGKPEGMY